MPGLSPLQSSPFDPVLGCIDLTSATVHWHARLVPVSRTRRHQGTRTLSPGHDYGGQLVLQPGDSRRPLSRPLNQRKPSGTSRWNRVQHQANEYRSAHFLRPRPGNSVQREPGPCQHRGKSRRRRRFSARRRRFLPDSAMNSTRASSRPSGSIWSSMPIILWKYTHNGYDFSDFLNTPIFFPVAWDRSKIHGPSVRVSLPNFHGLTAFFTASSVAARFFNPQVGGLGTDLTTVGAFRIDHDQKFQQTTHIQYQPCKNLPWIAFNWRYDNGLVAGAVPCFNDTNPNSSLRGDILPHWRRSLRGSSAA